MSATATPSKVRLFLEDHTGNKRREARIAAEAPVRELVPAVITALGLPTTDPRGRPQHYHLAYENRQLQMEETLEAAGVVEGATLTVVPEMTAG
ncbi:MAG: hypothetical protein CUN49_03810 [Candidatus Thermofonsia Clade 1 bacterium]|jgi:hypothetical protein|uniref:Ubiquitin-like domain-containing protein n=1 Tax=Candidatus Thermofonsia Clade 1 bacterium TaxID=2364210 RepID=A0A2M8PZX6_9CHLR|nr:MAG: hypothetical protein CUN49_03810 [Candidatus Thermofonsia Clade 1 bacterium]PJF43083.1 MAG: hypothetical protein CUN50_01465 [Candidatus Thermofonsia Clade 1 bacterium]